MSGWRCPGESWEMGTGRADKGRSACFSCQDREADAGGPLLARGSDRKMRREPGFAPMPSKEGR